MQALGCGTAGGVDVVFTEDSDLVAYGCPVVLFKLDKFGECQELRLADVMAGPPGQQQSQQQQEEEDHREEREGRGQCADGGDAAAGAGPGGGDDGQGANTAEVVEAGAAGEAWEVVVKAEVVEVVEVGIEDDDIEEDLEIATGRGRGAKSKVGTDG